jgi:hypothetical protein
MVRCQVPLQGSFFRRQEIMKGVPVAVRSLNLKMVLPRSEAGARLRQSLWITHVAINEAVAEIERVLLLCRGRSYYTGDDELVAEDTVRGQTRMALA